MSFITSEQTKKNYNKARIEAFMKDYFEVCKKHGLMHKAVLHQTQDALYAAQAVVDYKENKEKVL